MSSNVSNEVRLEDEEEDTRLPVSVLSGFLGAGKTTLLKKLLRTNKKITDPVTGKIRDRRIAVIVNDMGEINLDAEEIKNSKLIQEEAQMVEMHNGCICCTLRGDLLKTVKALSEETTFDYLVVESTGISEPLPVAQTFVMDIEEMQEGNLEDHDHDHDHEMEPAAEGGEGGEGDEEIKSLMHFARLDTLVTVVDAMNIFDVLSSIHMLKDKDNLVGMEGYKNAEGEDEDDRSIAQLMLEQIEFANVIIVSKTQKLIANGTVEEYEQIEQIKKLITTLNPEARIVISKQDKFADVDTEEHCINTGLFDMEKAQTSAGWLHELSKPAHTPETEEYGISSFVFRSSRPFHPQKLYDILKGFGNYMSAVKLSEPARKASDEEGDEGPFNGVIRSKGSIWLANSYSYAMNFHSAGKHFEMVPNHMPYLVALPEEELDEEDIEYMNTLKQKGGYNWNEKYGDRSNELVFIGVNLDKDRMKAALNEALIPQNEVDSPDLDSWRQMEDPFFGGICAQNYFDFPPPEENEDMETETQVEAQ